MYLFRLEQLMKPKCILKEPLCLLELSREVQDVANILVNGRHLRVILTIDQLEQVTRAVQ